MWWIREPLVDVALPGRRERFRFEQVDVGDLSTDQDVRDAVALRLGLDSSLLQDHVVLRLPTGHLVLRVPLWLRLGRWTQRLAGRVAPLGHLLLRLERAFARRMQRASSPIAWLGLQVFTALAPPGRLMLAGAQLLGRAALRLLARGAQLLAELLERAGGLLLAAFGPGLHASLRLMSRGLDLLGEFFEYANRLPGVAAQALVRSLSFFVPLLEALFRPLCRLAEQARRLLAPPLAGLAQVAGPWARVLWDWLFGVVVRLVTGRTRDERELDHRVAMLDALLSTPHRQLDRIYPVHRRLVEEDPLFYVHLAAWYFNHGRLRDHQEMFVVVLCLDEQPENREVGLALLRRLPPYQVSRVIDFVRGRVVRGRRVGLFRNPPRSLRTEVQRYLRERERDPRAFEGAVLVARKALKRLYATLHIRPSARAQAVLFDQQPLEGGRLSALKRLANSEDSFEQARLIRDHKLPYRVAVGAVSRLTPAVLGALVETMSPQEVINNLAALRRRGAAESPELRRLVEQRLEEARTARRVSALKGQVAAQSADLGEDWEARLTRVAEDQLNARDRLERPTALLVDASASMEESLAVGKRIASMMGMISHADLVVYAFDAVARCVTAPCGDLEAWDQAFESVSARGGTSVGAAVRALRQPVDGIILVTDGRENQRPRFRDELARYRRRYNRHVRVTFVYLSGSAPELERQARQQGVEVQSFRFDGDYYSLPELLPLLAQPSRLELLMKIMDTPLPAR